MSRAAAIRRLGEGDALPEAVRGAVVAVGNFDGVHRGHQAVLARARALAATLGRPAVCLTFEPHPRSLFNPAAPVRRLTPAPLKARLLGHLGFEAVVEWPFTRPFAALSAEAFVDTILVGHLGARAVVAGYDFHFGARRAGTPDVLAREGARAGLAVEIVPPLFDADGAGLEGEGAAVSSSRVRAALAGGEVAAAARLLGWHWGVEGDVVHGAKLGRTLGYPTANLAIEPDDILAPGIYAVRLTRAGGEVLDGVASYGRRPTFDDGAMLLETFAFDFSGDLYGERVAVSLFERLRPEKRFESVAALIEEMDRDAARARAILAGARPLSPLDEVMAFPAGAPDARGA